MNAMLVAFAMSASCSAGAQASVSFHVAARPAAIRAIAPGFVGMAFEYKSIPELIRSGAPDPVLVQLIRNLDPSARPVLRVGGLSTDHTWWPVRGVKQPLGISYSLSPRWMADARALARATDAQMIFGVGLQANQPVIDAVEADQLLSGVGRRYIEAMEIGNEPDLYTSLAWYRVLGGKPIPWYEPDGTSVFARAPGYGPADFLSDFARAEKTMPDVPLAGPETGSGPWMSAFSGLVSPRSKVRILTSHAYGLNQCVTDPSAPAYPSVPHLLAATASRGIFGGLGPYIALAHRDGAAFRFDEMGSVSCNGRAGVSDTLASALWVLDALFAAAATGADGVNLHTFPGSLDQLFDVRRAGGHWVASVSPLYYGALMFAQAAPAGARILPVSSGDPGAVRGWATRAPDGTIRVLLINDGLVLAANATVAVDGGRGPGALERLRAASAYATRGVTLGGQSFGAGTTTGVLRAPVPQSVRPRGGRYAFSVPPGSAALLTLPG
ncbi:MAG TPA: glycosyl hydrolase family 79 C-terminal domain-containing protein [Solirubrobacteraceae bacterium]|nr:glycosyl hydrolase family 79 C-terminal domain-containing protein [Solirubrobacteraceae bacterium]